MLKIETTEEFDTWFAGLDKRTAVRIASRLDKLALGLWGDSKVVGAGVTELREHFGAGYRVYVTQFDNTIVIALGGGDKGSQKKDIQRAILLAAKAKE